MDMQHVPPTEQPELRLPELFAVLKRRRRRVWVFALLATLAAGVLGLVLPKSYKATIVISPVSTPQAAGTGNGMSSLISQFGGLASLAGLAPGGDTKRAESLAVLQSELITEKYIEQNDLLRVLFPKAWDAEKKTWRTTDPQYVPTLWKGNEYFKKKVRTVLTDSKTGIVTMTIAWRDPKVAAKWANDLVAITNEYLRKKAIDESERNIGYLNEQAARTDVVAVKQAIYAILQTEINKEMLARGNEEYAFKILDPARAPERPSTPPVWVMMLGALFGSLVLSVLIGFVYVCWIKV
ncbi:MAG TPA: Wzz/FepE/Etk N-terminal domain-containing protein [Steroidobacteraceae bacterium]|nr:Wzz/FepE/Etk N-terminal domain-containing protein [Steroidobacteraceae bacterium]